MTEAARSRARVVTNRATASRATAPGEAKPSPSMSEPKRPSPGVRRAADLMKQAAEPTRLQILLLLGEADRNVAELCAALPAQSQPAVSHHISLLCHGRLIERCRSGKQNYYTLTDAGRGILGIIGSFMH